MFALLHVPERVGGFYQREGRIDDRLQLVLRDRAVHRLEARARTDRNALHPDHRTEQRADRNFRLVAGDETDHADETAEGQRRQRFIQGGARRFDDDLHAFALRSLPHRYVPVRRRAVVDADICTELSGACKFVVARRKRDDARAGELGELQGEQRHAAGALHI